MNNPGQDKKVPSWVGQSQTIGAIIMATALTIGIAVALVQQWQTGSGVQVVSGDKQEPVYRVDLNRAEAPELMLLPGIGETRARRIIDARNSKGPFTNFEEFGKATGLSESQVTEISKLASLNTPATNPD